MCVDYKLLGHCCPVAYSFKYLYDDAMLHLLPVTNSNVLFNVEVRN